MARGNIQPAQEARRAKEENKLKATRRRLESQSHHGEPEWIEIGRCFRDPAYGRAVRPAHVKELLAEFDLDALGMVVVSERADGRLAIIDGNHRIECLRVLGFDGFDKIPALVYRGSLTVPQEAKLWDDFNNKRRGGNSIDSFFNLIVAQDETACSIKEVLDKLGLIVSAGGGHRNYVSCVSMLTSVHDKIGADGLHTALKVIREAWPATEGVCNAAMIEGVAFFLTAYPTADPAMLSRKLQNVRPEKLLQNAKVLKDADPDHTRYSSVAAQCVSAYNARNRVKLDRLTCSTWSYVLAAEA